MCNCCTFILMDGGLLNEIRIVDRITYGRTSAVCLNESIRHCSCLVIA